MAEALVILSIIAVFVVYAIGGWLQQNMFFSNKQIIDFNHQKFTTAYVLGNSNVWEKVSVKAWKDWENSDSIQIVTPDGKAIYTHLRNVKLV